jgi:hypothetical protein
LDRDVAKYLLPEGILDYFEIVKDSIQNDRIHFSLEEKNIVPEEHQLSQVHSKGFSAEITIEDFPLRGKPVLLHIKRCRCTLVDSETILKRDWNLVVKGTRITNEFVSFLKDIA